MTSPNRAQAKTRVLYIVGPWRCGTTVLGNLLGAAPGVFCAGEIISLWSRLSVPGWLCGCGEPLRDCPVWGRTLERVGVGTDANEGRATAEAIVRAIRSHRLPWLLTNSGRNRLFPARLRSEIRALYETLSAVTGADLLVDTSKIPSYGRLLQSIPSLDVTVLHVVRDPRAVAFSWQRRKRHRSEGGSGPLFELPRIGWARSSASWIAANAETELLWGGRPLGYQRLRYEDFMAEPAGSIADVLTKVGLEEAQPRIEGRVATLGTNHSVAGNPNRHHGEVIELREDRAWLETMSRTDRALVSGLTAPFLRRYGYRLGA